MEMIEVRVRQQDDIDGGQVFDPASPHYADQFARWRVNQALPLAFEQADVIVDALCMNLVVKPQQYQMVVLPNLQGDIVSDLFDTSSKEAAAAEELRPPGGRLQRCGGG